MIDGIKKQIIIDTDPGHDDALAIMLLEKSGLFDIKAITTVAGNSTIQNTTNNARYILDLIKSNTPIYSGAEKPFKSMMGFYIEGIQTFEKTTGALMYDPLAAYYLINPDAFKTVPMDIKIETQSELTRGMTVADRRTWGDKKYNIEVAVSVDKKAFKKDFFNILNRAEI